MSSRSLNDTDTCDRDLRFAVVAEKTGYGKPLYLHDLTFARLINDVVFPYESDKPFFIDGVPVKRAELSKIKIIQQGQDFLREFSLLHHGITMPKSEEGMHVSTTEYPARLDALFRGAGDDVTSQVIQAYDIKIRPKLTDYLPKREELISAAFQFFLERMKRLGLGVGA